MSYRKLNAMTKSDSFPLPRIEDCVDEVGAARYVSKFNLLKGYCQVPLTHHAKELSENTLATFQHLMNNVVAGLEGCAVYLDDMVIYSQT